MLLLIPSGGQSCRLCGAVVRRNTKRLQVPCRKLAVANRHGQVLGGKKKVAQINYPKKKAFIKKGRDLKMQTITEWIGQLF